MIVGVALVGAEVAVERDVAVETLHAHALDKVEDVDQVGVGDVPALDDDDVHEEVEVVDRVHSVVKDDSAKEKKVLSSKVPSQRIFPKCCFSPKDLSQGQKSKLQESFFS